MENKLCDKCVRWLCGILFSVFAFCWLFFFQQDLLCAAYNKLFYGTESANVLQHHNHIIISLLLAALSLSLVIPGRNILRFKKGLYACNYLLSDVFLGAITGYDGDSYFGQSSTVWIVIAVFAVVMVSVCKMVASVPRSDYNDRPRTLTGNLLIMCLLFCMVGFLGNTDENLHRRLTMERLFSEGEYGKLLELGRNEEESDRYIDYLRAKAMLEVPFESNPAGSGIGELLFSYSISDPISLSVALNEIPDTQAYLASRLLEGNISAFVDSIDLSQYTVLPQYYMQALVLVGDSAARIRFPEQYGGELSRYKSFIDKVESLGEETEIFLANSTFIDFHSTYYWFLRFRAGNHN